MNPFEKKNAGPEMMGGEEDPAPGTPGPEAAQKLIQVAKEQGLLQGLEDYLKSEGVEASVEDVVRAAQRDDRTHGKKPEELVRMFTEDPTILEDLVGAGVPKTFEPVESADDVMNRKLKEVRE